tara:strand:+ start:94 stop:591 length:498 start_codon:yes stop_codon:yes gene_type:complete
MEMNQAKFEEKTENILVWMTENDIGALAPLVQGQINYGRTLSEESEIEKIWAAIRSMLSTLPNSPIKRGKAPTLPVGVSALIESLEQDAINAHSALIATENMDMLLCRLGKKSNGLWGHDEFALAMGNRVKQSLVKRYNLGIWDGTREGLTSQDFNVIEGADSEE